MSATAATMIFVTFLLYFFAALSAFVRIIWTKEADAANNALFSHVKTGYCPYLCEVVELYVICM